jgi:hypothetical protein
MEGRSTPFATEGPSAHVHSLRLGLLVFKCPLTPPNPNALSVTFAIFVTPADAAASNIRARAKSSELQFEKARGGPGAKAVY